VIIDGNKGLRASVAKNWVGIEVQRCTVHKLRNLERHTPRHALEQVKTDYHTIVNAKSLEEAKKAYREFVVKWKKLAPRRRPDRGGKIEKAYSLGIPKQYLAPGGSQTEEEYAYGEKYRISRSNGSSFRTRSAE
jgi:hypothetical protein